MKNGKLGYVAPALVSCALGLCAGCLPFPVILPGFQDLSDFQEFEFSRRSALGFCPPVDAVFSVTIRRDESERFLLEMSVLEQGDESVNDCEDVLGSTGCLVIRELPARVLTERKIAQVRAVFRAVTVETVLYFPTCVDPCVINLARWDDLELTDHKGCPSFGSYLSYEQMDEVIALLEGLRRVSD